MGVSLEFDFGGTVVPSRADAMEFRLRSYTVYFSNADLAEPIGPRAGRRRPMISPNKDPDARLRAVSALASPPLERNLAALVEAANDSSEPVWQTAMKAIETIAVPGSPTWPAKVMPLLSAQNSQVRKQATTLLAGQEPHLLADSFIGAYRDVFGPPRDRAVDASRDLGPRFLSSLVDRAGDYDKNGANLAASIAVVSRSPEVVPLCIRLLTQPDWWLRQRASEALAEIRDERGLQPLLDLLRDRDSDLSAAAALGSWGSPKALPGLLEAYKRGAMDLRLEILEAFAKINDPRIPALLQNISTVDPEPVVREKAHRLLRPGRRDEKESDVSDGDSPRRFDPVDFASLPAVTLDALLTEARAREASDLHLAVSAIPHLRVNGTMESLPVAPLGEEEVERMLHPLLTEAQRAELAEKRSLDFCLSRGALGRFRTNIFYQRKGIDAVFRLIPPEIPTLEKIGIPLALRDLVEYSQGLVLVTGAAGMGKTTTLAAFVDLINRTESCHILCVEEPIEYVHRSRQSLVNQREVGIHTHSFAKALRQALREDPDVIMVGELRDLETISLAITASETGHLVFGTLHTASAAGTVDRVIDAFPAGQQGAVRQVLADSLKAVITQHLLPRRDGTGRVAAYEVLRITPNIAGLIREAKTHQIHSAIQTGSAHGMQTMDSAMLKLVADKIADPRAAYDRALRKEAFEPYLDRREGARKDAS
jgi:twitching motility protein PilT